MTRVPFDPVGWSGRLPDPLDGYLDYRVASVVRRCCESVRTADAVNTGMDMDVALAVLIDPEARHGVIVHCTERTHCVGTFCICLTTASEASAWTWTLPSTLFGNRTLRTA